MLKGIKPAGGLKDFYLLVQQKTENEIEYQKTFVLAQAQFGNAEAANKALDRLRDLLGLKSGGQKKDAWMEDPKQVEKQMSFLKNLKVSLEK